MSGRPSLRVGWHQTPASEGGRWDVKAFGAFSEGTGHSQAKSSNEAVGGSWQEMLDFTLKQSQLPGLHTIQASLCPRVPCGPRAAPAGPDPPPSLDASPLEGTSPRESRTVRGSTALGPKAWQTPRLPYLLEG